MMDDDELRRAYGEPRESRDRSSCPGTDALRAVIERDGPEAERLAVVDHVMACAPCRAEFDLIRSFAVPRPPLVRWQSPALAIAAVALLSVGVWWTRRAAPVVTRGTAAEVVPVTAAEERLGPADALVWRSVAGAIGYRVELRDSGGVLIGRDTTSDTAIAIRRLQSDPAESRVYWSVMARRGDGSELRSLPRPIRLPAR